MQNDIVTRLREKYAGQLPICSEAADEIERLRADRDRWVEIAQLWDGAYSAQTYIHGLDEIETADMARKAQAKAVAGE